MEHRSLCESELIDWLRLARSTNVGPRTFDELIRVFDSPARALEELPDLARRGGNTSRIKLCSRDAAEREIERITGLGARLVALCEPDYPALLRHIDSRPPVFSMAGDNALFERHCIAMVGARNASAAGRRIARSLAHDLGQSGLVVASGLARGIDTAAHEASLDTGTVAVIAGGIDIVYPPENDALQRSIGEGGVVMTEMPPGLRPQARHFPRRNRLISGLSLGVIVVEAAERSGSLITARNALEQDREVFAVPGSPADPRAAGTNKLIRQGAELIRNADDVLEALSLTADMSKGAQWRCQIDEESPDRMASPVSHQVIQAEREQVVAMLGSAPVLVDDLIHETGVDASSMQTILLELDLAGRLQRHGNASVSLLL